MSETNKIYQNKKQTVRQSNIELLRIIAMIMIVGHHFFLHGGYSGLAKEAITINTIWLQFIGIGGKIGVDIFILISGYFLISSDKIKTSKVIKLWLQLFTYSIVIGVVFFVRGDIDLLGLIKRLFPVTLKLWWFASVYFVLYLLTPYINRLLNSFSRQDYLRYLVVLGIFWTIIPTFLKGDYESNNLLWFIYLYSFAGYIRLYGIKTNARSGYCLLFSFAVMVLTVVSVNVLLLLGKRVSFFYENAFYFYGAQKLTIFLISVSMFIGFLNLNVKQSRFINTISSAMFGVYLIHDYPQVRYFLWNIVSKHAPNTNSVLFILYSIFIVFVILVLCSLIELFRINVFERLYLKPIEKLSNWIGVLQEKVLSSFLKITKMK